MGLLTSQNEQRRHPPNFTGSGGLGWGSLSSPELKVFAFLLLKCNGETEARVQVSWR